MLQSADFPKISHLKKRAFLAAFSRCGSLSKSAKRAKVDRRTHYNWLKDDPWYVHAFRQAAIEAGDSLEDRLTEMAFDGNVTAAIFLLKGLKPEKFRERVDFKWNGDFQQLISRLSPSELETLEKQMLEIAAGGDPAKLVELQKQLEAGAVVIDAESTPVEPRSA
jgi:hypothetical protein